jgi:alkylation response protein AidB-like acyl-CoA dehydrogenase
VIKPCQHLTEAARKKNDQDDECRGICCRTIDFVLPHEFRQSTRGLHLRGVSRRGRAKQRAPSVAALADQRVGRRARGMVEESPLERLFRDARLGPFSPISNEMVRNFVAERIALPRSY